MTGVLTIGESSIPHLPQLPPVLLENEEDEKSKRSGLFQLLPINPITPPEFMEADGIPPVTLSAIAQTLAEQNKIFIDTLTQPNPQPEIIPISEATTGEVLPVSKQTETFLPSIHKLLFASNPLVQFTANNQNPVINTSYRHQQHLARGFSQPKFRESTTLRTIPRSTNPSLPTLAFGNTGNGVRVLQQLLVINGYVIPIDGNFGALTESAVKAFQIRQNLVVDGIVGHKTWSQLTT